MFVYLKVKDEVLTEVKKNISRGKLGVKTLNKLLKNASNLPQDILQQVVDNMSSLAPEAMQELAKNLDVLPPKLKDKVVNDMVKNLNNLDASVKKQVLSELAAKPTLIKDKRIFDTAVTDMANSLKKLPEAEKLDVLKSLAKNINNLSSAAKEKVCGKVKTFREILIFWIFFLFYLNKVMKEVFNNLENGDEDMREMILKQLAFKMGEKELEEWIKNSDMPDEFKKKIMQDLNRLLGKKTKII